MQYVCRKRLTAGGMVYHAGAILPDGVILPERSGKLLKSGYIAELDQGAGQDKRETADGKVPVALFGGTDRGITVLLSPKELNLAFSIMQMNAEDSGKAIADITSENVLVLLHAADSRKKVKEAAKKQADKLISGAGGLNGAMGESKAADGSPNGDGV